MSGREYYPMRITVSGPPRTKKTSNRIRRRANGTAFVAPSAAWERWLVESIVTVEYLPGQKFEISPGSRTSLPFVTCRVNCKARFYRDKKSYLQGDQIGFGQGLADLLEKRGVVENDRLFASWDGTRLDVDLDHPRTEVLLERVGSSTFDWRVDP